MEVLGELPLGLELPDSRGKIFRNTTAPTKRKVSAKGREERVVAAMEAGSSLRWRYFGVQSSQSSVKGSIGKHLEMQNQSSQDFAVERHGTICSHGARIL